MGVYLHVEGKYERATEHLRESLNIQRRLSSVNKVYMASSCYLSRCLLSQCLTKEAEYVMREGYGLAFSTDNNCVKAYSATLLAYAIHLNEGTEKEVKKLLQQSDGWIQMMREDRGKAEVLSEMGEVLVIRGDYKRANRILQKAATIQRHFLPTNHWETAITLCRMAESQVKQDQLMAALPLFHESSEMMSKAIGVEHPIRGRSLFGVGKVYLRQQKWQEAETILKESVNVLGVTLGYHPTTSAAIRDLNYCLRMLKKDQEAFDILQQHQRVVSYHQGDLGASAFQDLQKELEQLREKNELLARNLQQSETEKHHVEQHQRKILQTCLESLHLTGSELGKISYGDQAAALPRESGMSRVATSSVPASNTMKLDDIVSNEEIVEVASHIESDWGKVAAFLDPSKFSQAAIKVIEKHSSSSFQQAREMLEQWTDSCDTNATRSRLRDAMVKAGLKRQAHIVFDAQQSKRP
ncbi:uncharacterized protein LOC134182060 isoform X2 [Corticium candelabrum]|nr:uncharacterized protein LOC134182060 isoform X2 [Corticium candelabrum]